MKTILEFTDEDMQVLQEALIALPYKLAAPLIAKINIQIQRAHDTAADKREGATQVSRPTTTNSKAS